MLCRGRADRYSFLNGRENARVERFQSEFNQNARISKENFEGLPVIDR
ncbi:conserved hypothetical protein [delta proteobacterium NaphS2]|nr:conserved hypothetical protein [delta proteobacterium NaphS2]